MQLQPREVVVNKEPTCVAIGALEHPLLISSWTVKECVCRSLDIENQHYTRRTVLVRPESQVTAISGVLEDRPNA